MRYAAAVAQPPVAAVVAVAAAVGPSHQPHLLQPPGKHDVDQSRHAPGLTSSRRRACGVSLFAVNTQLPPLAMYVAQQAHLCPSAVLAVNTQLLLLLCPASTPLHSPRQLNHPLLCLPRRLQRQCCQAAILAGAGVAAPAVIRPPQPAQLPSGALQARLPSMSGIRSRGMCMQLAVLVMSSQHHPPASLTPPGGTGQQSIAM